MANYATLKAAIADVVKTNGEQAITGANLQSVLLAIVNSIGADYIFAGVATPSTSAGTPDQNVCYIGGAGTYANFGTSVTVPMGSICVFKYNGSWTKDVIDVAYTISVQLKNSIEPLTVSGNELLTVERNILTDEYVEGSTGIMGTHTGYSCYKIPVSYGKTYSYKPAIASSYTYAIFLYNSAMQPVKCYGANTSLPAIQAIGGEAFPANNQYGYKEITIPDGVCYVVFNKDINSTGSPEFFEGVAASSSTAIIEEINYKKINAANGMTAEEKTNLDFLGEFIEVEQENAFKFSPSAVTPTSTGSFSSNRYIVFVAPDFEHEGILNSIVFSSQASAAYNLLFAIFKKNYTNGVVTSLTKITTGSVPVASGSTTADFSQLSIEMKKDYVLGFDAGSTYFKNTLKYGTDNTYGYPLWTVRQDDSVTVHPNKLTVDFNYSINYKVLDIAVEEKTKFADLNVVVLGDSITWMGGDSCNGRDTPSKGWTTYFKEKAKPKSIRSYARSGATISHTSSTAYNITENTGILSNDNVIYNQINRLIADVGNSQQVTPDLIIIAGGTNDAWYPNSRPDAVSVTADTEFANTDSYITSQAVNTLTSIAAALRYDVELIKTNFPYAQVIILTPLQSTAFTMDKCRTVGDIIEGCAGYLAAPSIRQDKKCGVYRATENTAYLFTTDGTHPSVLGAKNIGYALFSLISDLVRNKIN